MQYFSLPLTKKNYVQTVNAS